MCRVFARRLLFVSERLHQRSYISSKEEDKPQNHGCVIRTGYQILPLAIIQKEMPWLIVLLYIFQSRYFSLSKKRLKYLVILLWLGLSDWLKRPNVSWDTSREWQRHDGKCAPGSPKPSQRMRWVSNYLEMNGPPYLIPGAYPECTSLRFAAPWPIELLPNRGLEGKDTAGRSSLGGELRLTAPWNVLPPPPHPPSDRRWKTHHAWRQQDAKTRRRPNELWTGTK